MVIDLEHGRDGPNISEPLLCCKHGTQQKGSYGKQDTETAPPPKKMVLFSLESWAGKKIVFTCVKTLHYNVYMPS